MLIAVKDEVREEILARIKSAREFNWEGGFEPEFLVNFIISKFDTILAKKREEIGKMRQTLPKNKCRNADIGDMGYNQALRDLKEKINNE